MNPWLVFLAIHFVYDWHIQGDSIGTLKRGSHIAMFVHCLTYAILILAAGSFFGLSTGLGAFALLYCSHYVVDGWKAMFCPAPTIERDSQGRVDRLANEFELLSYLIIDQGIHILVLWIYLAYGSTW
jgi:hypothetical protein